MASNIDNQYNDILKDSPKSEPLEYSLELLRTITMHLRRLGIVIVLLTALNFVTSPIVTSFNFNYLYEILIIILTPGIVVILSIVWYDLTRKKGDALFEEISDELQWRIARTNEDKKVTNIRIADERPALNVRVKLREYAQTTDLPVIPGKFGPALYALINIISLLVNLYIFRILFR